MKSVVLSGKVFGFLTVLSCVGKKHGYPVWNCHCACGNEVNRSQRDLLSGSAYSCGHRENLMGARFGKWTVVGPYRKSNQWLCRCDCGQERYIGQCALASGSSTSCGHPPPQEDLTGKKFGKYVVVRKDGDKWVCRCGCGRERLFARSHIVSVADSGSCKACANRRRRQDIEGRKFGKLTVGKFNGQSRRWECRCDCGKVVFCRTAALNNGSTASCGCRRVKNPGLIDLAGKRFGTLSAILPTGLSRNGAKIWRCKCDCGKEVNVASIDLRSGNMASCGCMQGKKYIAIDQFKFDSFLEASYYLKLRSQGTKFMYDERYPGMSRCRYDFFLPDENTYDTFRRRYL